MTAPANTTRLLRSVACLPRSNHPRGTRVEFTDAYRCVRTKFLAIIPRPESIKRVCLSCIAPEDKSSVAGTSKTACPSAYSLYNGKSLPLTAVDGGIFRKSRCESNCKDFHFCVISECSNFNITLVCVDHSAQVVCFFQLSRCAILCCRLSSPGNRQDSCSS